MYWRTRIFFSVSTQFILAIICNMGLTLSKTRQFVTRKLLNIDWHDILPLLYFDEIDCDS